MSDPILEARKALRLAESMLTSQEDHIKALEECRKEAKRWKDRSLALEGYLRDMADNLGVPSNTLVLKALEKHRGNDKGIPNPFA